MSQCCTIISPVDYFIASHLVQRSHYNINKGEIKAFPEKKRSYNMRATQLERTKAMKNMLKGEEQA